MTTKRPHLGLDQQGRAPDAMPDCTELDDDDGLNAARGLLNALIWSLALWFVGALAAVAVLWP